MTIIQPNIHVPPAIEAGLRTGNYIRQGSVVRHAVSKRIVAHLKEVHYADEMADRVASATARLKWMPSKSAVILTAGAMTVAVAALVVHGAKKQAERNTPLPECVKDFGASWEKYQAAIRDRRLDLEILDQLISDFDALQLYSRENNASLLGLTPEQGISSVSFVADYTSKLAHANGFDLTALQENEQASGPLEGLGRGEFVDLRRNLAAQRKIFGDAA